jgi:hypothetical protein
MVGIIPGVDMKVFGDFIDPDLLGGCGIAVITGVIEHENQGIDFGISAEIDRGRGGFNLSVKAYGRFSEYLIVDAAESKSRTVAGGNGVDPDCIGDHGTGVGSQYFQGIARRQQVKPDLIGFFLTGEYPCKKEQGS